MTEFRAAPLDSTARVVSGVLVVMLVVIGVVMWTLAGPAVGPFVAVLYVLVLALSWAMAPRSYAVQGGDLVVNRNAWRPFRSPLRGLAEMSEPGRMGLRVAGSGGGFGYYGRFRRSDIGAYRAYLTSRANDIVVPVTTDVGIVTVSPADPQSFVARVSGR